MGGGVGWGRALERVAFGWGGGSPQGGECLYFYTIQHCLPKVRNQSLHVLLGLDEFKLEPPSSGS